jgi:hypothetical protein
MIKLTLIVILGSVFSGYIISNFIVPINWKQYLGIELVITFFHYLYNYHKLKIIL